MIRRIPLLIAFVVACLLVGRLEWPYKAQDTQKGMWS
jgi:hypothetical protein